MTSSTLPVDTAGFPLHVLREYALIADGERGALIGPRGDMAWLCAPRWDAEAVFSTLIGGDGLYAVAPAQEPFVWGGSYEEGSLIWRNRWVSTSQVVECRDALAFPGDPSVTRILRRVLARDGETRVRVVLDPRAGFGRFKLSRLRCGDGVWTARCGPLYLRWVGAPGATERVRGGLEAVVTVPDGRHHDLVLEVSEERLPEELPDPDALWVGTAQAWAGAVPVLSGTIADRDARHA
jgi:alpha,alpha-trehalase